MSLQEATAVAYNIVTSAAVVIGGIWAYVKFLSWPGFANRAELDVSAYFGGSSDGLYLCVTVTLKNPGLSRVRLNENMKAVRILGTMGATNDDAGEAEWKRIITLRILEQHDWLESQETVNDSLVYQLPAPSQNDTRYRVYQVEAIVGTRPRRLTRKRVRWQARTVVFLPSNYPDSSRNAPALANLAWKGNLIRRIVHRERGNSHAR